MSKQEDAALDKLIEETNKHGNKLLSEFIIERVSDNKRKFTNRIASNEVLSYQKDIENLKYNYFID
jgi:hypothetical protein